MLYVEQRVAGGENGTIQQGEKPPGLTADCVRVGAGGGVEEGATGALAQSPYPSSADGEIPAASGIARLILHSLITACHHSYMYLTGQRKT